MNIKQELMGFIRSENFYKDNFMGMYYTDGFKRFLELCQCHWLFTDMAVIIKSKLRHEDFIVLKIKVNDFEAKVTLDDGNSHILWSQDYEYTDFPLSEYKIYVCRNEKGSYTFMLPTEY